MLLEIADPMKGSKGVYELGDHLIMKVKEELKNKRLSQMRDDPLVEGEEPEELANTF